MKVAFTFGRFNPPTIGHQFLVKKVKEAGGRDSMIYASQTQNNKKDPLTFNTKIERMKKSFPECAAYISSDPNIRNIFDALVDLYNKQYTEIEMIVGSDRVKEFKTLIEQYNDKDAKHGYYKFMRITVTSAGERDPDSDNISGMSATKVRKAASEGDFDSFVRGISASLNRLDKEALYHDIREGLKISEEVLQEVRLTKPSKRRNQFRRFRRKKSPHAQKMQRIRNQIDQLNKRKQALQQVKSRLQQRNMRNRLQKMNNEYVLEGHKDIERIEKKERREMLKIQLKARKANKKWGGKVVEVGTDEAMLKHWEMTPKHPLEKT